MSIVMDGFDRGRGRTLTAIGKSGSGAGDLLAAGKAEDREYGCSSSSSSSSSIGKNSHDEEGGENEAESPYKGPLDMMESLEEALPIRSAFV